MSISITLEIIHQACDFFRGLEVHLEVPVCGYNHVGPWLRTNAIGPTADFEDGQGCINQRSTIPSEAAPIRQLPIKFLRLFATPLNVWRSFTCRVARTCVCQCPPKHFP